MSSEDNMKSSTTPTEQPYRPCTISDNTGYVSFSEYTPVVTPSMASVCWDDLGASDTRDLQVKVDDPQKHVTSMETYITFRVSTKTCRVDFDESEYEVRRRYNDFVWLRARLIDAYPTHIVPPLPKKHSLMGQLDRYQLDFIRFRMALLHRFVNRLADHPVLSCDNNFKTFLILPPAEFGVHRSRSASSAGSSALSRLMSDALSSLSTTLSPLTSPPARGCTWGAPVAGGLVCPVDLQRPLETVASLAGWLQQIERTAGRVHKYRQEYESELAVCQPCFSLWASSSSCPLSLSSGASFIDSDQAACSSSAAAAAVVNDCHRSTASLSSLLRHISTAMASCLAASRRLSSGYQCRVVEPLQEYVLYCGSVLDAADTRRRLQHKHEHLTVSVHKRRQQQEQLTAGQCPSGVFWSFSRPTTANIQAEQQKVTRQLEQLVQERESCGDLLECANSDLSADLERWLAQKDRDLTRLLFNMATDECSFYQQCVEAWESVDLHNLGTRSCRSLVTP